MSTGGGDAVVVVVVGFGGVSRGALLVVAIS